MGVGSDWVGGVGVGEDAGLAISVGVGIWVITGATAARLTRGVWVGAGDAVG